MTFTTFQTTPTDAISSFRAVHVSKISRCSGNVFPLVCWYTFWYVYLLFLVDYICNLKFYCHLYCKNYQNNYNYSNNNDNNNRNNNSDNKNYNNNNHGYKNNNNNNNKRRESNDDNDNNSNNIDNNKNHNNNSSNNNNETIMIIEIIRGCLHEISFRVIWNIFNSVSGLSLVIVYMRYPEMKLIAGVISLRSFWQKWNFTSGDKMLCKHYSEMKSSEMKHLRMRIFYHNKDGRKHDYHMSFWENCGENNKRYYEFLRRRCTTTKTNYRKAKIRNQVKQMSFASVFLINI